MSHPGWRSDELSQMAKKTLQRSDDMSHSAKGSDEVSHPGMVAGVLSKTLP